MVRTKQPCSICGHLISLSNMSKHLARHERGYNAPFNIPNAKPLEQKDLNCSFALNCVKMIIVFVTTNVFVSRIQML